MPLLVKYDEKSNTMVEVPGAWIDDEEGIKRESIKQIREYYSLESEVAILREAVIAIGKEHLPQEYQDAVTAAKQLAAKMTTEAELQKIVKDPSRWESAGLEKAKNALASIGLSVPKTVVSVAELKTFAKSKITNIDDVKPG